MKPLDPRLLRYARQARLPVAVLAVLGAATAGLVIVQAQYLAAAIAGAFTGHDGLAALRVPVIGLAVVVAARAGTAWATHAMSHKASAAATAGLRQRLLARAVELGPSWLAGQRTAQLAELATRGIDDLDGYFTSYLPALVLAAVVPVAVLARVAAADPLSALVIALTLPLLPLFGALIGAATARHAETRWRALGTLAHHFLDVVTGLPTLKVFGRARPRAAAPPGVPGARPVPPGTPSSIERVTQEYRRATMATLRLAFLSSLALELIATTSVALVAVEVGLRLASGGLSLRAGLLALILAPEAYLPLRTAGAQFHATADGLAAAGEAFAILEAPAPGQVPGGARTPGLPGAVPASAPGTRDRGIESVSVDGVSVRHEGRNGASPDGVSLTIRPGSLTVLAGPSGCGKSTLIAALLGFITPDEGRILITARGAREDHAGRREVDLRDADLGWWRSLVGWVPQEPTLFPGTVAGNIRLGWPQAPDGAVRAAALAAALDDVPLDTMLADRGAGLSAGQRRRVALARALLASPDGAAIAGTAGAGAVTRDCPPRPVLLLDEPTAGLDPATEARVIATLRAEAARGRVVLAVSHHPAVLAAADEVVRVMAPGAGQAAGGQPGASSGTRGRARVPA